MRQIIMLHVQNKRRLNKAVMHKTQGKRHKTAQFPMGCGAGFDLVADWRSSVVFAALA
jgi:hypothetical protein